MGMSDDAGHWQGRDLTQGEIDLGWDLMRELSRICDAEVSAGLHPSLVASSLALTVAGLERDRGLNVGCFDEALKAARGLIREIEKGKNRGN